MLNLTPQIDHLSFDLDEGFGGEISHFVRSCLGLEVPLAPVADGVAVTRMVEAVYASAAAGPGDHRRRRLRRRERRSAGLSTSRR